METICAIMFTALLILPLLVQLQMLIADPKKLCKIFNYYATSGDEQNSVPELLQFYPKTSTTFDAASNSKLSLTHLRAVSSTPALQRKSLSEQTEDAMPPLLPTKHSSPFVKTDEALPIVDITWNYESYRYKALEASLRHQYGNNYPPGEVVLNSMQLNLLDSTIELDWNVNSAGLFDGVKESDVALDNSAVSRKLEIEYLNPLDHFATRRNLGTRPSTEERFTETINIDDQEVRYSQECQKAATRTADEKHTNNRRSSNTRPVSSFKF